MDDDARPDNATTEPEPSDAALVARCRTGDEAACEVLVRRYAPRCTRLAGRFLAQAEDVADVVQDALASAFAHLDGFDAAGPFWPWLARMVVNRTIDRLRSARARPKRAVETFDRQDSGAQRPDEALVAEEERERVRRVLDTLPLRYRTLLVLREMEGMTAEEIAGILGRPAATVRWRLFRARRLFRDAWIEREQPSE